MHFGTMELTEYGVYDSRVKFPGSICTQVRQVCEYEIELYMEDQPGISYLDDREIPLKAGTFLCAKPGMYRHSRLPLKCLYFHLQTEDPQLEQLLRRLPTVCTIPNADSLGAMFRKLLTYDPDTFPEECLMVQSSLLELLHRLIQQLGTDRADMLFSHRKLMHDTERYIREHLSENLDLQTLAQQANLSASYFHKLFTRHFGTTPTEYVISCRISLAKTLLMEGEMSMQEVAEQSGFSSQAYFNFRFKQQTGQTPLQYRRNSLSRLIP